MDNQKEYLNSYVKFMETYGVEFVRTDVDIKNQTERQYYRYKDLLICLETSNFLKEVTVFKSNFRTILFEKVLRMAYYTEEDLNKIMEFIKVTYHQY